MMAMAGKVKDKAGKTKDTGKPNGLKVKMAGKMAGKIKMAGQIKGKTKIKGKTNGLKMHHQWMLWRTTPRGRCPWMMVVG